MPIAGMSRVPWPRLAQSAHRSQHLTSGFSSAVIVNPFPHHIPPEVRAVLTNLQHKRDAQARPVASRTQR
jgi:hypothetical protein